METKSKNLRYGENPHQSAKFHGDLSLIFDIYEGKDLSFNNLIDIDAAVNLMKEFLSDPPTFAILKHTNPCGVATRQTIYDAWQSALSCDNVSAFGGVFICNSEVDYKTAESINKLFYEVLIAPSYTDEAKKLLTSKKGRIILTVKEWPNEQKITRTILNGLVEQSLDNKIESVSDFKYVTSIVPGEREKSDLIFAIKCVKHLKSNAIAIVRNNQLIGMGCGQTSRVDALQQAIKKSKEFGFSLEGSVMASEAFFPFTDCVEIANEYGIKCLSQPGGSVKDNDSINYCNENGLSMIFTGFRHFKH